MNVAPYHTPCIEIEGKTKTLYWMGATNQTFKKEASLIVARIASRAFKSISRLMPNFAHLAFLPQKKGIFSLIDFVLHTLRKFTE